MSHWLFLSFVMCATALLEVTDMSPVRYSYQGVQAPGNIIIGGLFPFHEAVEDHTDFQNLFPPHRPKCTRFYTTGLNQALAMIHAVEMANKSPLLRSLNITLGYRIYDTCSDVTTALWAIQDLTQSFSESDSAKTSSQFTVPSVVLGTTSSEISIAVARELNLLLIPQISYASTAIILSDKSRFPAFMRTVPNDQYQTRAMVKLLKDNEWTWVGLIITDGDYGRSALESFVTQASMEGICVAFKAILPDSLADEQKMNLSINQTVDIIVNNPKVKVVVSFAKSSQMKVLLNGLHKKDLHNMVWLASDNWSTAKDVLNNVNLSDVGYILGFTFKSGNVESFYDYLQNLPLENEAKRNSFLKEFLEQPDAASPSEAVEELLKNTKLDMVFSIEMAVSAITKAVVELCGKMNCANSLHSIQPWQLLEQLRNISFEKEGLKYKFDENGDINLGYDICLWNEDEYAAGISKIAKYEPSSNNFTFINESVVEQIENVLSQCSSACLAGEYKKTAEGQHICCFECLACPENHYSLSNDTDQCSKCDTENFWSNTNSSQCYAKTREYFRWTSGFAVVLLTLAALGVLLLILMSALFIWQRHSPVVKAAGGPLCQLILFSLLGSFISVMFFVGEPSDLTCKARQVIFGLSFTLCVSCILVKSLKILLAFQMNLEMRELLCKLYKPYVIVSICMMVQVIICTVWLTVYSPYKGRVGLPSSILLECNEGSNVTFGLMLGHIALLALICFTFAYKGRKLPQKYNEAKFITFGMLIYLMAWVIFIPVHITTTGVYVPAVEVVVIIISNYGILSCHFLPKCYIIIFKKQHNTKDAFKKNVYEYAKKSAENIRGWTGADLETKTEISVYIVSNPSLGMLEEEQASVQKSQDKGLKSSDYVSRSAVTTTTKN